MNVNDLCKGNKIRFVKYKWREFVYAISFDGKDFEFPIKIDWVNEETLLPEMNADTDFVKRAIKTHIFKLY